MARKAHIRNHIGGLRFGRLVVRHPSRRHVLNKPRRWICECDCGGLVSATSGSLKGGKVSSCGCLRREMVGALRRTHGQTRRSEHVIWVLMRGRCLNDRNPSYPYYGGRGISVCDRWGSFEAFLEDMGPRPSPAHSIDRINVNGNYEPGNCRWATDTEQARNTRRSVLDEAKVARIKRRLLNGESRAVLVAEYGTGRSLIGEIARGRVWADVEPEAA